MGKVAVLTDSNSGIVQAEAEELGIYVVPMPFMIDGETYYEDITLTQEQFYQRRRRISIRNWRKILIFPPPCRNREVSLTCGSSY